MSGRSRSVSGNGSVSVPADARDGQPTDGVMDPAEWLGRRVRVVVDRPLGSEHPTMGFTYPVNYGYVPGFVSPDGEELDAYVIGPDQPLREFEGEVVAVVLRADDIEDKLIVSDSRRHSRVDLERAVHFQERYFSSSVVVGPA